MTHLKLAIVAMLKHVAVFIISCLICPGFPLFRSGESLGPRQVISDSTQLNKLIQNRPIKNTSYIAISFELNLHHVSNSRIFVKLIPRKWKTTRLDVDRVKTRGQVEESFISCWQHWMLMWLEISRLKIWLTSTRLERAKLFALGLL